MEPQFRGRFEVKLDGKGRLILPSSYRQTLPDKNAQIVVTNSQHRGLRCLDIYSISSWERLEKKISKMSALKSEVQAFQRFYISGGQVLEPDNQNRATIPQSLRAYAGLEIELVLVGMGEKFEVWPATTWARLYEGLAENFEATLAAVAELDGDDNE